jgi:uncharacterized protein (UPF0212 family)
MGNDPIEIPLNIAKCPMCNMAFVGYVDGDLITLICKNILFTVDSKEHELYANIHREGIKDDLPKIEEQVRKWLAINGGDDNGNT